MTSKETNVSLYHQFHNLNLKVMTRIINNHEFTLSTQVQQAVNNAAANLGIDTVVVGKVKDVDEGQQFQIYDEDDNYLFTVDSDAVVTE